MPRRREYLCHTHGTPYTTGAHPISHGSLQIDRWMLTAAAMDDGGAPVSVPVTDRTRAAVYRSMSRSVTSHRQPVTEGQPASRCPRHPPSSGVQGKVLLEAEAEADAGGVIKVGPGRAMRPLLHPINRDPGGPGTASLATASRLMKTSPAPWPQYR